MFVLPGTHLGSGNEQCVNSSSQGALTAFMSLSALYNIVGLRPLFVRERSNRYYRSVHFNQFHESLGLTKCRPSVWLLSRLVFDVIPLRIVPTIVVSTMYVNLAVLSRL